MNYFIGFLIPEISACADIINLIDAYLLANELVDPKKVVNLSKVHFTFKFIGKVQISQVKEIENALSSIRFNKIEITINSDVVFFGRSKKEPLLAIMIETIDPLLALRNKMDVCLEFLNLKEDLDFNGHISIVTRDEKNKTIDLDKLNLELNKIIPKKITLLINKFQLISSEGGVYQIVQEFFAG